MILSHVYVNKDGPVFDNYLYVEDGAVQFSDGVEIGLGFVIHSFGEGYQKLYFSPVPAMAVGPNHVMISN